MPIDAISKKLDSDFFAGRWARITDRQRDLLCVIASLDDNQGEFGVQELVARSRQLKEGGLIVKGFTTSHIVQMLATLAQSGFVYKNRHGRYSLAIPLFGRFIRRQM